MSLTTAVGLMMVGSLNLLSIAFAVLFVGLGVDFGIQFSVRYRSERFKNDDLALALENAARRSAVPLSLAAMATAAGFLCFLPTDYKGISELGKIAGAGMLIAFITSITALPALLKLLNPPGEKRAGRLRVPGAGRRIPRKASRHRSSSARCWSSVAGLPLLYFMKFDFNPINLRNSQGGIDRDLPRPAQGPQHRRQRHQRADALRKRTPRRSRRKLEKLPEVLRVMSLDSFVPDDQPAKLQADRAGGEGGGARAQSGLGRCGAHRSGECRVAEEFGRQPAQDRRRRQGPGAVASRRLADALPKLAGSNQATRDKAQNVFVAPMKIVFDQLKNTLQARPVTLKTLPPELVEQLEVQGRADPRRGAAEGRSQRQRQSAPVCRRRARRRADRDRRAGVDPQIRRHHRQGVHPRRHSGRWW